MFRSVITGWGSYIPENIITNSHFLHNEFFDETGERFPKDNQEIIQKFEDITEISQRRYLPKELFNSDMATAAAQKAIEIAGVSPNEFDYVLVAHNFGDITYEQARVRLMPSISATVKHKLQITNNKCRPYDVIFGCPGWVEALIMADQYIKAGMAKKILVIGSDNLSRTIDSHDRNGMIFADGAGAVVVQAIESDENIGVIGHKTISDNQEELEYLYCSPSINQDEKENDSSITMKGRKIYEYALKKVPALIKTTLDENHLSIEDIDKVLLHQANAKMDHAMVNRLFRLYNIKEIPEHIAPMTIQNLGNTSVATIPTMYDLIKRGNMEHQEIKSGDTIVFASVGAGMNINAIIYREA